MSRFGTGERAGRTIRSGTPSVPLTGTTETLDAPGLAFQSPSTNNDFAQLSALLGEIGQTANAVAGYESNRQAEQRRLEAEQERQAYLAEQEAKKSEQARRGLVAEKAQPIVAEYGAMLQAGTLDVRGKTLDQVVGEIIAIRWQGVTDPVVLDEARQQVQSGLAAEYQTRLARTAAEAEIQLGKGEAARVFAAPDSIASVVEQRKARNPGMQEADVYVPVYEAAQRMAREGSANFESTLNALPDSSYSVEKSALRAQYQAAKSNQTTLRRQAAEDTIGTYRYQKNYPVALSALQGFVDSGTIDGEKANTIRKGIEEEQRSSLKVSLTAVNQARKDSVIAGRMSEVRGMILAGKSSDVGDLEVEYDDENGHRQKITIDGTKAVKDGFDVEFARAEGIAPENYRPENYVPSFVPPVIDLATRNGYLVPQWKNRFAAAENQMSVAASMMRDGTPDKASAGPMMIQAYKDYQKLYAINPSYARNTATDQTAAVFDSAMMIQKFPQVGNDTVVSDQQALLSAIQGVRAQDTLDKKSLQKSIATLQSTAFWRMLPGTANKPENASEIYNRLAPFASYLSKSMDPESAAETAFKSFEKQFVEINGHFQIAQPDLPPLLKEDLPKIAEFAIGEYVSKYGAKYGVTADELTMRPVPNTRLWQLWFKGGTERHPAATAVPAENTDDTTFGYGDLWKASNKINQRIKREIQIENDVSQRAKQLGITNKQETAGQGLR